MYCASQDQPIDIMTKPLKLKVFEKFKKCLNLQDFQNN